MLLSLLTQFCKKSTFLSVVFTFGVGLQLAYAQLPQNHAYQRTLRNYLSTLTTQDFEVDLQPIKYSDSYFSSGDDLYPVWLMRYDRGRKVPTTGGIKSKAVHFTLDAIENGRTVNMTVGRGRFIAPVPTIWWNNWDYEGNPYYDNRSIRNRAFTAVAVDMMMLDQAHEAGKYKRTDYLGTHLIWYGYVYEAVKDDLPSKVQSAFETGMRKMFQKAEEWGSHGVHADMDLFAVVGMWYIAEAIGDNDLRSRAKRYAQEEVFGTWTKKWAPGLYHPAGFIDHGGGFDPSYQGITMFFSIWAALASDDPFLKQKVDEMSKLKAYLTLPEPGVDSEGEPHFYSPSHFATATTMGSANDQWAPYSRDVGAAMVTDQAKYLVWGGRERLHWETYGIPDESTMRGQIRGDFERINNSGFMTEVSTSSPSGWDSYDKKDRWTPGLVAANAYYQEGFYEEMKQLQQQKSPLTKAPFKRDGNFIENFDDTFLSAKFGDYGVILHTGNLSWWGDEQNLAGFGGGSISAFWTAGSGSVLLGQKAGYKGYNGKDPDVWADWRQWPTHAISGVNTNGQPFSSARQKTPEENYNVYGTDSAYVEVSGSLSESFPAPNQALSGEVNYSRQFKVTGEGVTVTSSVQGDGSNKVSELYEMIPILLKHDYWDNNSPDATIEFKVDGSWQQATTSFVTTTAIRITRLGEPVFINFKTARRVKLSPQDWTTSYKLKSRQRNIMVDLLDKNGDPTALRNASVTYIMSQNDVEAGAIVDPESKSVKDTVPPEAKVSISPSKPTDEEKVTLTASATDNSGIQKMEIFVEGNLEKTCKNTTDCEVSGGPFDPGTYSYHVKVTDKAGNQGRTSRKEVTIGSTEVSPEQDTAPPELDVSLNPFKPNDQEKITLIASATDDNGIQKIEIFIQGRLEKTCRGTGTCKISGGPFAAGKYSYRVVATDKATEANKKDTGKTFLTIASKAKLRPNNWPTITTPELTKQLQKLQVDVSNLKDEDGDSVFTNIDWRVNGNSIALINYSFDVRDSLARDLTSYRNHGKQLKESFTPAWAPEGKKSAAYYFDGNGDYIFTPSSKEVETLKEFTVEMWIKHDKWGDDWATLVSKPFYKSKWEDPWSLFKLGRKGSGEQLNFQVTVDKSRAVSIQSKSDIPSNEWVHIAGTYDGSELKIYVNGELDNKTKVDAPLVQGRNTGLYLGTKWGKEKDKKTYRGFMDEFRLFDRALTSVQIKNHYQTKYAAFPIREAVKGQKWTAVVTPTDRKEYGKSQISNTVTIKLGNAVNNENKLTLAQNYPNPFRSKTNIEYHLPDEEVEVSLTIYDILGQKIAKLVRNETQSGVQNVSFNASALGITSGIYFYQLKVGDRTLSKKMTYIK